MTLKICIIGESGVGKTSLINRFTKDKFSNKYRITVGADLFSHDMNVDGDNFSLQVNFIRFGIQQVKKNFNQLVLLFIEEAMHVY